jgi:hypothetical protein
MKTEKNLSENTSSRSKDNYISNDTKSRLFNYLNILYDTQSVDSIYIGGSQSINTPKLPSQDSDIDLYVILHETLTPITYNEPYSQYTKLSLGLNVNIYDVNYKYKEPVIIGMELLTNISTKL